MKTNRGTIAVRMRCCDECSDERVISVEERHEICI